VVAHARDGKDQGVTVVDAVVIGAGPNGLAAANLLADAGWEVLLLEANDTPGGAVRTAEVTAPGFRNDLFSAFYPMTAASPVFADLELHRWGLEWTHAPSVLAHPREGAPAAILSRDLDVTCASLDRCAPGDGDSFRRIHADWRRVSGPFMETLLRPFPPIRPALRLAAAARVRGLRDLAHLSLLPLRRFVELEMRGESGRLLFAGNALHADLTPESAGSALFGWLLVGLAQEVGFPVPVGGAQRITEALVSRFEAQGGRLECGRRVDKVEVRSGRAVGVVTADGTAVAARHAVLADCDAQQLLLDMVGVEHLPADAVHRLGRIQRASATFKVDWALSSPIPWSDRGAHGAGTVHVAESLDELTITSTQLAIGEVPDKPFLLVGQMTTSDATRSPAGTESAWAYTHVPHDIVRDAGPDGITGSWGDHEGEAFARRMEQRIERLAPGFTNRIIARHVASPPDLQRANANLVGGDVNGGTAQLHQQLIFRPISGLARPETPVRGLYLASASAHPGGAVHGACGANAARAAIAHRRVRRVLPLPRRRVPALRRGG
jgi:phytoene dehydrogenase-like protein